MKSAFSAFALLTLATLAAFSAGCADDAPIAPTSMNDRAGLARIISIRERPIEEFVFAQGGVAGSGMGASLGVAGGITWIDRALDVSVAVDYAGVIFRREVRWSTPPADASSEPVPDDVVDISGEEPKEEVVISSVVEPPVHTGRVLEQILSDGSVRVIVDLATSSALAFASAGTSDAFEKVFFGATAYRDQRAVRGESRLRLVYRTPAPGSPMPQISRLIYAPMPGESIEQLVFTATASSSLPPALQDPKAMTLDYKAFGGLGGSLGAVGTISGAVVGFQ
jgi:hypothetical protein